MSEEVGTAVGSKIGHQGLSASVNHIGMTVTDIELGIAFYQNVLGYRLIAGPLDIVPDDTHFGQLAIDILGTRLKRGRFAHLVGSNGVGLELFDFDDPEAGPCAEMEYWKNGFYHIAFSTPDIDGTISRIEAAGGRRRSKTWEIFPGAGRYLAYAEDPFGNPIELYTHSYQDIWVLAAASEAIKDELAAGDGPVTLVVELKAQPDHAAELLRLTKGVIPKALSEPFAESIELFAEPTDPTRILLIEQWGSRAYVTSDAHTQADHMAAYFGAIGPLMAEPPRWAVWNRSDQFLSPRGAAKSAANAR